MISKMLVMVSVNELVLLACGLDHLQEAKEAAEHSTRT
jgi:hypothetical protein